MKNYKKLISLILGSAFMLGSGVIIANAQEKEDKFTIDTNKLGYIKVSDDNQNYSVTEEDFYKEMHDHCHGNNKSNLNYRNNMMRNYDNTNLDYNDNGLLQNL